MDPNSGDGVTVVYIVTSSGIRVPVRFVPHEDPFDTLFYGFDDLPAPDDRGTKRARDGADGLKEVAAADLSSAGDECAICLRGFRAEETARAMPACAHAFHHHCISEWLRRNPTCPLCRRELPEEEEEEDWEIEWEDGDIICDSGAEEVDERRTRRRIISSDTST